MNIMGKLIAGAALTAAMALTASTASAAPSPGASRHCFFVNEWRGWSSPDPSILYLKVGLRDVYRVDLVPGGRKLHKSNEFLVSQVRGRGSNSICSHLDLDLAISDHQGFRTPLFPRAITRLSPEEIAAIPPKYRP